MKIKSITLSPEFITTIREAKRITGASRMMEREERQAEKYFKYWRKVFVNNPTTDNRVILEKAERDYQQAKDNLLKYVIV